MELDLKKVFYIIVCITMIALVTTMVASPIKAKIEAQKSKIESVEFAP